MTSLQPLPVPTRVYGGEGIGTYSRRHAERNHTTVEEVEKGLRERGVLVSKAKLAPERLEAWRQLGNLHTSAFTLPKQIDGNEVTDRSLCLCCTAGYEAVGKAPRIGMVCNRHRRWVGNPQIHVRSLPALLTAERQFRNHLVTRGIMVDSYAMILGQECANVGVSRAVLQSRTASSGIENRSILLYPEQIALARLVCHRNFLDVTRDPDTDRRIWRLAAEREVYSIIPASDNAEPGRAMARIWSTATKLSNLALQARLAGEPAEDPEYYLRRQTSL